MKNNRPLVCRFGALGDLVMVTPLLKRLYERSGIPVDFITIGEWSKHLFDHMPYINDVYTINSRKTPHILSPSKKNIVKLLKQQNYANAWVCESNINSIKLLSRGGITTDNSISSYAIPPLTNEHFVEYWMRLADMSPENCDYKTLSSQQSINTELFVTDYEKEVCKNWLGTRAINSKAPLICIQAGNKRTTRTGNRKRAANIKYWPEKNWAEVIDTITEYMPDAQILLCGVPSERPLTLEIKSLCRDQINIFSIADDLPIRRLMALLSISHSCISVDTGPAHIAAALNCPLTVLFGKTDARLCSPKSSESQVIIVAGRDFEIEITDGTAGWGAAHDMSLITIDAVFRGWKESLD